MSQIDGYINKQQHTQSQLHANRKAQRNQDRQRHIEEKTDEPTQTDNHRQTQVGIQSESMKTRIAALPFPPRRSQTMRNREQTMGKQFPPLVPPAFVSQSN